MVSLYTESEHENETMNRKLVETIQKVTSFLNKKTDDELKNQFFLFL